MTRTSTATSTSPRVADGVLELIGGTPMLRLHRYAGPREAEIFAKLEFLNPGFSVKDRIGVGMIERAERAGRLKPGGTIIEPTAGNTGVGLALAGVQKGYRVILCVPENFSIEKREVMKALGGEVVLTPKDGGMKAAIAKAEELARDDRRRVRAAAVRESVQHRVRTTRRPAPRSSNRWTAASTRGWPAPARAARSPASRSTSANGAATWSVIWSSRRARSSRAAKQVRTKWKASAHRRSSRPCSTCRWPTT